MLMVDKRAAIAIAIVVIAIITIGAYYAAIPKATPTPTPTSTPHKIESNERMILWGPII